MYHPGALRLAACLLACLTVVLGFAACRHTPPELSPVLTPAVATESEFLGNAACAECHAKEFDAHKGSHHDLTMRAMTREGLGEVAPPTGTVPLAGYAFEEQAGRFVLTKQYPKQETQTLDVALGSGKSGMTYISILSEDKLMETRMSYFVPWKFWEITPGQEVARPGDQPFGRVHGLPLSRNCMGCHAVTVPANRLMPEPKFFGVGCESCHGPGRAHVAAARAGEKVNHLMEDLGRLRANDLNNLCGKCHRTAEEMAMGTGDANETQRFQVFGLVRSRCRLRNGQMLSCLSCHDSHKNASTDKKSYEAVCLSCHATNASKLATANSNVGNGKPCPVNAKTDCIRCHMPPRKAFPKSPVPAKMVDHFIRVRSTFAVN